jgi:hypothetical protein
MILTFFLGMLCGLSLAGYVLDFFELHRKRAPRSQDIGGRPQVLFPNGSGAGHARDRAIAARFNSLPIHGYGLAGQPVFWCIDKGCGFSTNMALRAATHEMETGHAVELKEAAAPEPYGETGL